MAKAQWSIPIKQALPILVVAISLVAFVLGEQAERRELHRTILKAMEDPFRGRDMDRLLERVQVELDRHTRQTDSPALEVPDWRIR